MTRRKCSTAVFLTPVVSQTLPSPGRLKPEGGALNEGLPNVLPQVKPGPGAPGSPF